MSDHDRPDNERLNILCGIVVRGEGTIDTSRLTSEVVSMARELLRLRAYVSELVDMEAGTVWTEYHWREALDVLSVVGPGHEKKYPDGGTSLVACVTCRGRTKVLNPKTFSHAHASGCSWGKAGFPNTFKDCDCNYLMPCPDCQED